jgi:V8-like Glu-specific endopeptidase
MARSTTARLKIAVVALGALVVLAAAVIVGLLLHRQDPRKASAKDLRGKQGEGQQASTGSDHAAIGHTIYETNESALFMLVAHHPSSGGDKYEHGGFCTAFAIRPRVLASNAHCVRAAEDFEDDGAEIYAHLNESSNTASQGKPKMLRIGRHRGHPLYRHNAQNITPDVGLFELEDEDAPTIVTMASLEELQRLGTGDPLYVLGFPGRTMDEESPVAVFMFSHVGRITDEFGQRADDFKDAWLVQHEGQTTPGTSGSPIFDEEGHVVAINAGGLLEGNQQAVYKYAMRIDLVLAIDLDAPEKK